MLIIKIIYFNSLERIEIVKKALFSDLKLIEKKLLLLFLIL